MVTELRIAFNERIDKAKFYYLRGEYDFAFALLEEAHILGQRHIKAHTIAHFWMLKVALKQKDIKEIWGQLIRLPMGILASATGFVPVGNTGGANVSALKRMPIPHALQDLLNKDR